jgi:hypothetical protein
MANTLFGTVLRQTAWSTDATEGWHVRNHNWQYTVSLQHELRPGLGVTAGYYRTVWGNGGTDSYAGSGTSGFVVDNLAVTPGDYTEYCVTAPVDPRLPGNGGYPVCGAYDLRPGLFGQVNNLVDHADKFGERTYVYDGIDASLNWRFGRGGILYGGFSTGRINADQCAAPDAPEQFCSYVKPFSSEAEVKISGSYPLPYRFHVSATFVNAPGIPVNANWSAPNSAIAPSLGRNLAACGAAAVCTSTATVRLIEPFTVFEERLTKLDLRFGRSMQVGRLRLQPRLDVYNVFNANTVLSVNQTFGPVFGRPLSILGARMAKVGLQVDF